MYEIYFIQINLICLVLLILIAGQIQNKTEQLSTAMLIFKQMLWTTFCLCVVDMIAGLARGQSFPGAKAVLEISNLLYYEAIVVIGYFWMQYVDCRLDVPAKRRSHRSILQAIPLILFTLAISTNYFTHFIFNVDENNEYQRNAGIYIHWIVAWGYLLIPTIKVQMAVLREKSRLKRREIHPLLFFVVPPIITSVIQMLFYGVSLTQVGVTISLFMIFVSVQTNQIQVDALTGLNNRRGLEYYLLDHIQRHEGEELSVLMIDVNHFKQINDKFGHITGDAALKEVSEALREACRGSINRPFLCRYGGDEFVLTGIGNRLDIQTMIGLIQSELENKNKVNTLYNLSVSIGCALGKCTSMDDVDILLRKADNEMYLEKERSRVK